MVCTFLGQSSVVICLVLFVSTKVEELSICEIIGVAPLSISSKSSSEVIKSAIEKLVQS